MKYVLEREKEKGGKTVVTGNEVISAARLVNLSYCNSDSVT